MFLSVVVPSDFAPNGHARFLRSKCLRNLEASDPILDPKRTNELRSINEYSLQFHHDSLGAVTHPQVNPGEVRGFVVRTLALTRL